MSDMTAEALADILDAIARQYGVADTDIQIKTLKRLADEEGEITLLSRDVVEAVFLRVLRENGN